MLFLDPDQPQLHRWSLTDKTFAPSVPLDMAPTAIASDRAGTTLFLAFVGGRIDTLTVADQARALFAMAPDTVEHLVVLDGHLLAFEVTDRTRALYNLISRQRVFFGGHNRTSREAVYAPGLHRVFSHSYDAANGVVEASDYDRAAPKLSAPVGPALPVQAKLGPPLRLFPGEDLLASANGDVLRTSDLTRRKARHSSGTAWPPARSALGWDPACATVAPAAAIAAISEVRAARIASAATTAPNRARPAR